MGASTLIPIRVSHIIVSAHGCFPGDCMLLSKAMPIGWVMAWTTKLRKYTHVHNTAKLLKWRKTYCHWTYKWVWIYKTCWFEFNQPSDLTSGLVVCPIFSYLAIQEELEWIRINFWQDIWFNTCLQHQQIAVNHVSKGYGNGKTSK